MDAKPQRPLRTTRLNDENAIAQATGAAKAVHQRHKSTPVFSGLMINGALKGGAQKRSAFADVSNQRTTLPSKDDLVISTKNGKDHSGGVKGINHHVLEPLVKDSAFARKPLRGAGVKSNASVPNQTFPSVQPGTHSSTNNLQTLPQDKAPKRTVVLKENIAPTTVDPAVLVDRITEEIASTLLPSQQRSTDSSHLNAHQQNLSLQPPQAPSNLTIRPTVEVSSLASQVTHAPAVNAHSAIESVIEHGLGLSTLSSYPESQEEAQAALQAILQHEQQQRHLQPQVPSANVAIIKPVAAPQAQASYEPTYDVAYETDYTTRKSFGLASDTTGCASILLALKHTTATKAEVAAAKRVTEAARSPEEVEDDMWDTTMVAEYGEEIFEYMRVLEDRMLPNPHYMDHQTEVQWSMRAVLLDWLIQVHARFTLLPETLFLSINYIDRFLSCKVVSLAKLQLVGATALFLAAKYEEVNCPSISEIVYMVDNGYTVDEILKAERFMLSMLCFELGWPGPMSFLRRISKADDYDLETRTLAKYFLEVTIMDERFVGCPPSATAAASHCLARQMLRKGEWTQGHVYYSDYTYSQLLPLLTILLECCEAPDKHHSAVYVKYQDKRYKRASIFVQNEMHSNFQLHYPTHRSTSFGSLDVSAAVSVVTGGWRGLI